MWNKDEIEGKQIEGVMKDQAGGLVTNPDLEAQGKAQGLEVKVQEGVNEVHPGANDPLEKAGKATSGK